MGKVKYNANKCRIPTKKVSHSYECLAKVQHFS